LGLPVGQAQHLAQPARKAHRSENRGKEVTTLAKKKATKKKAAKKK